MKKLLLATAVAALSVSAAHAAPTIYGKAFLTLDLQNADTDTTKTTTPAVGNPKVDKTSKEDDGRSQLNSNGSRIGIKGSEALTANTDMVYQLEFGINVDQGEKWVDNKGAQKKEKSDQFYSRDTFIGLSNAQYGTLVAGRLSAIDGEVDFANVTQGGVLGGDGVLASFDAPRANNSFAYFSPDYNGTQFMAMYVMDENSDEDTLDRDAFGVAATYTAMPNINLGASYIYAGDGAKFARISGDYALNEAVTLGALYQNSDFDTDDNENAFTLSGKMATATPWSPYAQLDFVTNVGGADDADTMRVALGSKYNFNAHTTGHIYGAFINEEATDMKTVAGTTIKTEVEKDGFGIGAGLEYKF